MTQVLVLDSDSLLGNCLVTQFGYAGVTRDDFNILSSYDLDYILKKYNPEVVINCYEISQDSLLLNDHYHTLRVNAFGPKLLANQCNEIGCRLIHLSTNEVYSGVVGQRTESDFPSPIDLYAMSKQLGEVLSFPHLTIRTSVIGFPDPREEGLLAQASKEKKVIGKDKVIWNGLTSLELGTIIHERLLSPWSHHGLLHIKGEAITEMDILLTASAVWNWKLTVIPESRITSVPRRADKTLNSHYSQYQSSKTLYQMLKEQSNNMVTI